MFLSYVSKIVRLAYNGLPSIMSPLNNRVFDVLRDLAYLLYLSTGMLFSSTESSEKLVIECVLCSFLRSPFGLSGLLSRMASSTTIAELFIRVLCTPGPDIIRRVQDYGEGTLHVRVDLLHVQSTECTKTLHGP